MVDGRIFHLEFQTERESSLERFLDYDTRLARRYHVPVRTVIFYEARVASAPDTLDLGTIQYRVENVLLRYFQGETVLEVVVFWLTPFVYGLARPVVISSSLLA